jgi:putative sugar O-methyltransferase
MRTARRLRGVVRQPFRAADKIGRWVKSKVKVPRLLSYQKAFDAVMSCAEISVPIVSAFALDHGQLARNPKVFMSSRALKRHYQRWSGYQATANIINHYYYQNVLRGFCDPGQIRTILEIGAGNGNFTSILYHDWAPVRVMLIDLPETLAVAIPFLSGLFPRARLLMPNEIPLSGLPAAFDFAFLTVDQLQLLGEDSVDLAINCHSFQEMTHEQIGIYMQLVQRVCRESGWFFVANRVEKIPSGPDAFSVQQPDPPNRMAEYPWDRRNQVLVYETSRLSRLVQLDDVAIRLERIRKPVSAPDAD